LSVDVKVFRMRDLLLTLALSYDVTFDSPGGSEIPVVASTRGDLAYWDSGRSAWIIVRTARFRSQVETAAVISCGEKIVFFEWRKSEIRYFHLRFKEWGNLQGPPLKPRSRYSVAIERGRFAIWGGASEECEYFSDGAIYDFRFRRWIPIPPSPLEPRHAAGCAWVGRHLFVWGGANSERCFDDGALFCPESGSWTRICQAPLRARGEHAAVRLGKKVLVCGGSDEVGGLSDAAVYDPGADRWEGVPSAPIRGRILSPPVVFESRLYLLFADPATEGGYAEGCAVFDIHTRTWSSIPEAQHKIEEGASIAVFGGRLRVVARGCRETIEFDPKRRVWRSMGTQPFWRCCDVIRR
jgi:hypothetical protein